MYALKEVRLLSICPCHALPTPTVAARHTAARHQGSSQSWNNPKLQQWDFSTARWTTPSGLTAPFQSPITWSGNDLLMQFGQIRPAFVFSSFCVAKSVARRARIWSAVLAESNLIRLWGTATCCSGGGQLRGGCQWNTAHHRNVGFTPICLGEA